MSEKYLYDGFGSFDLGINSGIAAQLLPPNQCAFATDATFRGLLVKNRPSFKKLNLTGLSLPQLIYMDVEAYQPDSGSEYLQMALGGRLFRLLPDTVGNAAIDELTGTSGGQSATAPRHYLYQTENFMVWNDGANLPLFWDGATLRRSLGKQYTTYGEIAANPAYSPPAPGSSIVVNLTTVPATGFQQIVEISDTTNPTHDGARYEVTAGGTTTGLVNLTNLYDTPGTVYPAGTPILFIPKNIGINTWLTVGPAGSLYIVLDDAVSMAGLAVGTRITINSAGTLLGYVFTISDLDLATNSFHCGYLGPNNTVVAGALIQFYASTQPNSVVGILANDFTVPAIGTTAQIQLQNPYVGETNVAVWIGSGHYKLAAVGTTLSTTVTLKNISDTTSFPLNNCTLLSLPELPAGRMGTAGMGRTAQSFIDGLQYILSDIVGGSSGSSVYAGRDAVLKITENTMLTSGNFCVPGGSGLISAMTFPAMLDTSLGQGPLQIFASKSVFSCNVPVDSTTWQKLANPISTEALKGAGAAGANGLILSNSDIIFRSPDGQIRSIKLARQDFDKWGNTPISIEIDRVLSGENLALMPFCSGIEFDNRGLFTCNPLQTGYGVIWQGIIALNFDPISSLQGKSESVYDGLWTGLNILKLVRFKNVERAFAVCLNGDNQIELWEILTNDVAAVSWSFEAAHFFYDRPPNERIYKRLVGGELSAEMKGDVTFTVYWRPDSDTQWHTWYGWTVPGVTDAAGNPVWNYRPRMGFGSPPAIEFVPNSKFPAREGFSFQLKLEVSGLCTVHECRLAAVVLPQPEIAPPFST